jgi:hypothetical protein
MQVKPFDLSLADLEAAALWLSLRSIKIDGHPERMTWLDHLVGSVVASAKRERKPKGKEAR